MLYLFSMLHACECLRVPVSQSVSTGMLGILVYGCDAGGDFPRRACVTLFVTDFRCDPQRMVATLDRATQRVCLCVRVCIIVCLWVRPRLCLCACLIVSVCHRVLYMWNMLYSTNNAE